MNRFATTLCAAALAVCSASAAMAASSGVVNMEQIFKTAPQVKNINATLQKQFSGQKNAVMEQGKTLQADLKNYNKNKSVMSKEDSKKLAMKIADEENQLRTAQAKFQQALFAAQNKAMAAFMKTVDAAVAKVAAKKKLGMVFPKNAVVYSHKGADITNDVMSNLK